jgi:uncharacterized membrane protein YedE/YeeE
MQIVLAVVLGFLFGFILQKTGAANPARIAGMLSLKDFHLMKEILLGIGGSSFAVFVLLALGVLDGGSFHVKASYVGVIVGGAILGLGWAVSGFCPGTGVVAAGAGRRDGMLFVLGGMLGSFLFVPVYASLKSSFLFNELGGKMTLAATGSEKYSVLLPSVPPLVVAGGIALVFVVVAFVLPVGNGGRRMNDEG